MKKTFKGGIIIDEHKNTASVAIDRDFSPSEVIIPMSQHIGAPCVCTVKKGDSVKRGQLIGAPADGLSCPVHASVSGTVKDIVDIIAANGRTVAVLGSGLDILYPTHHRKLRNEILKKGCQVARAEAAETLDMVRRSMKINYFEDADLIRQQSEAYKSVK